MGIRQELISGSGKIRNIEFNISGISGSTSATGSVSVANTFIFKDISNVGPCRLRLYGTSLGRDNDLARPISDILYTTFDVASASLLIETVDEIGQSIPIGGRLFGANLELPSSSLIYYTIEPSGSAVFDSNITSSAVTVYGLEDLTFRERISVLVDFTPSNKVHTGSITTPNIYLLLTTVPSSESLRMRLYQDSHARDKDLLRVFSTPISSSGISGAGITSYTGSGLIVDIVYDSAESMSLTPIVVGDLLTSNNTTHYTFEYTASLGAAISASVYFDLFSLEN